MEAENQAMMDRMQWQAEMAQRDAWAREQARREAAERRSHDQDRDRGQSPPAP